jgi:hypothetical protein
MSLTGLVGSAFGGFETCGMDCYGYLGGEDFSIVIVSMVCLVHCVYKFASCCLDFGIEESWRASVLVSNLIYSP